MPSKADLEVENLRLATRVTDLLRYTAWLDAKVKELLKEAEELKKKLDTWRRQHDG